MAQPFFSIIVVSYNAEKYIFDTIRSVLDQSFQNYEIIVKDACSKDQTLEMIPQDSRIRVYSTKDTGIYDGMNEAIGYAKGAYCMFLNCGDVFYDAEVLSHVYSDLKDADPANTLLYGNCYRGDDYVKQPSKITSFYLYRIPLNHQTMFFGTELFPRLGNYDTQYRICADHEFTIRAFQAGVDFVYCPATICYYMGGGLSESAEGMRTRQQEQKKLKQRYFSRSEQMVNDIKLFFTFRGLRKMLVSGRSPQWVRKLYRKLVNLVNK